MHINILCILLLIKTLRIDGKGHRVLSKRVQGIGEVTPVIVTRNDNINLPNGFNPQPSPMNPMLYPFATQQPIMTITGSTSGWRPIIRKETTKIPLLEDRFATVTMESHREVGNVELQKTSTPPYPIRPLLQQTEFIIPDRNMDTGSSTSIRRNGVWRQIGGFIEGINNNRPVENPPRQQTKLPQRVSNEKYGRRRIANFIDKKRQDAPVLQTNDLEKPVNANFTEDTALLSIAKQINESVELNRLPIHSSTDRLPNVGTDVEISVESYNKSSSDSAYQSNEGNRSYERNTSISNKLYNFFDDSSEATRANGETNYDDIFTPTSSFNITKVGVPFEDQNSAEELSICVPLSVRERSLSNENEIVDVERVYCFPLPIQDKNEMKINENGTVRLDAADDFGTLNYEDPITSNAAQINAALAFISIGLFLI